VKPWNPGVKNPAIVPIMPPQPMLHPEFLALIKRLGVVFMHRGRSSGCTPSAHPFPSSSSIDRFVKSSQGLLKYVQSSSVPDIQISTGAVSATRRNRDSLSLTASSPCFRSVMSWAILENPTILPVESLIGPMVRESRSFLLFL